MLEGQPQPQGIGSASSPQAQRMRAGRKFCLQVVQNGGKQSQKGCCWPQEKFVELGVAAVAGRVGNFRCLARGAACFEFGFWSGMGVHAVNGWRTGCHNSSTLPS